jgi:ATP-dependent Lon protease
VLIPKDNEKDLAEIPQNVLKELTVIPVTSIDEVLEHSLVTRLVPIEWIDDDDGGKMKVSENRDGESVVTH